LGHLESLLAGLLWGGRRSGICWLEERRADGGGFPGRERLGAVRFGKTHLSDSRYGIPGRLCAVPAGMI
jgi:hypothetical protein